MADPDGVDDLPTPGNGGPAPDELADQLADAREGAGNGDGGGRAPEEKLTRDALKLIDAIRELDNRGRNQSLRKIARRTGLSKDEVRRYLNPEVPELYNLERLVYVRERNRPLYNYLIVSGPPKQEDGEWVGIQANTSKFDLFEAVCKRYGYDLEHVGEHGRIVDLEYQGIERIAEERMGKRFRSDEPILHIDRFRPQDN